jgi:uncharacterized protein (DUF885 family)
MFAGLRHMLTPRVNSLRLLINRRSRAAKFLLSTAVVLLAAGCSVRDEAAESVEAAGEPISAFFERFTADWVRADPDLAVRTRYFSGEEQDRLERQLTARTRAHRLETAERARKGIEELKTYDIARLTETERVAAEVMRWQLEVIVESEPFLDYEFPLQQMRGANVSLVNALTVTHPLRTARDAENYLARLGEVGQRMQESTAEAARRSAAGIRPPTFILRATIEQMERFLSPPPAENPLVTTLIEKIEGRAEITEARRDEFARRAAETVQGQVYPAWRAAVDELRSQLPLSSDDAGLWRFDEGEAVYAHRLRRFTTTDLTADQIHEIGLREVARIEAEMESLLRQIGLTGGSLRERVELLTERLSYPPTDEGRAQIMADIRDMMRDAEERAAHLFDLRPRADVIAQPYPRFRWENAAASYTAPPLDGSRPGIFQMPLRPDRLTRFALRSLVYHETVPGHHFQIALATENADLPRFMQVRALGGISAITEGWALYAERLAAEEGWYESDIEGRVGQLNSELFRARRLVVDTGLHAKGWTRQQAIDYGISPSEVERYVVYPGQACSYMIGQLKIIELRDRAREVMGERFSIRDFHNAVLHLGSVPLTVLESEIERYISS